MKRHTFLDPRASSACSAQFSRGLIYRCPG
jgi:hypothetical protein